jgi:hypothetical protein
MAGLPFQKWRNRNSNAEIAWLNILWKKTFNLILKFMTKLSRPWSSFSGLSLSCWKKKTIKIFQVSKIIEFSTNFISPVETFITVLSSYPWKFKFCSNLENYWVCHQLIHCWIQSKQWLVVVRAFSAILSAKGCNLVFHKYFSIPWKYSGFQYGSPSHHTVFSCPVEIFRVSIRVNSSIYGQEQGFRLKESIPAFSIFNNKKQLLPF